MSVLSGFDRLHMGMIHIAKRGMSFIATNAYSSANGLYEKLVGAAPMGGQRPVLFPHDHAGEKGHAGIPLGRNNLFTFDDYTGNLWDVHVSSTSTYYRLDRDNTSSVASSVDAPPNFVAYVSPGIDTNDSCLLEAKVLIYVTGAAGTTYVRFRNKTEGSHSTAQSTATVLSLVWLSFSDITALPGTMNEFDVEVSRSAYGAPYDSVEILNICLSETRPTSEPASAGTFTYNTATKP